MKAFTSAIVLGVGFLMISGNPARAQVSDTGDAMNAGLPMPGTGGTTPAEDTGAASTPVGEPKGVRGAASTPVAAPGANAGMAAPAHQP
jgi:hypothetical protein